MSRRVARETAMSVVFEKAFGESVPLINDYLQKTMKLDESDNEFVDKAVEGVFGNLEFIDSKIAAKSVGWSIDRLPKVDLAIMRLAVYEMLLEKEAPAGVVINEALEIAKKYSTPQSAQFINGVLDAVYKDTEEK